MAMDDDPDNEPEPLVSRHPTLLAIVLMLVLLVFYGLLVRFGIEHIGPVVPP